MAVELAIADTLIEVSFGYESGALDGLTGAQMAAWMAAASSPAYESVASSTGQT